MYAEADRQNVYDFDILTLLYRTKELLKNIDLSLKALDIEYTPVPLDLNFQTISQEALNKNRYKTFDIPKWLVDINTNSLYDLFRNNINVEYLVLSNWNVSDVISMSYMLGNNVIIPQIPYEEQSPASQSDTYSSPTSSQPYVHNSNLTYVTFDTWNTSKVTDMSYMFAGCTSLPRIDVQCFDMSKVTNMSGMFAYCSVLNPILLPLKMSLDSVMNMSSMFYDCYTLTDIDISHVSQLNAINMSKLFCNCSSLKYVNLPKNLNLSTNLTGLFFFCLSLESINMQGLFSSASASYNLTAMFYGCKSLKHINFSNCSLSPQTITTNMFLNTPSLELINVTNCDDATIMLLLSTLTHNGHTANVFSNEQLLIQVGMINVDEPETLQISSATQEDLDAIPYYCIRTLTQMNEGRSSFKNNTNITNLVLTNLYTRNLISLESEFSGCTNLLVLDLSNWDTFRLESTKEAFSNCTKLFKIEPFTSGLILNNSQDAWDTPNITDMSSMFLNCTALTRLDLSMFNTSRVETIGHIFDGCISLLQVSLSNWDTSSVQDMSYMFCNCEVLTEIDLSNWDVSNVVNMNDMFAGCSSLRKCNLSNWNIKSVKDMSNMFLNCTSLETLNLSNWDTSDVNNFTSIFNGCTKLKKLDLSNWNMLNATNTDNLFAQCISLQNIAIRGCSTFTISRLIESLNTKFKFVKLGDNISVYADINA